VRLFAHRTVRCLSCHPILPTASRNDRRPSSGCDWCDAFGVVGEKAPCGAGFVDDVFVAFEHGDGEFVAAQIFPNILDRVQLWRVGRQAYERDVAWNGESRRDVIARAIEDERSMRSRRDPAANGAKNVNSLVALVAWRTRSGSSLGPNAGQRTLLTDSSLVLEPDFDGLVFRVVGEPRRDRGGSFFKRLLGFFVGLGMTRTHREPAVAQLRQQFADRAFMQRDTEASFQPVAQIHTPPAHYPMTSRIGPGLDQPGQFDLLLRGEFWLGTRRLHIVQAAQASAL
jgi:hypothetical protein